MGPELKVYKMDMVDLIFASITMMLIGALFVLFSNIEFPNPYEQSFYMIQRQAVERGYAATLKNGEFVWIGHGECEHGK